MWVLVPHIKFKVPRNFIGRANPFNSYRTDCCYPLSCVDRFGRSNGYPNDAAMRAAFAASDWYVPKFMNCGVNFFIKVLDGVIDILGSFCLLKMIM